MQARREDDRTDPREYVSCYGIQMRGMGALEGPAGRVSANDVGPRLRGSSFPPGTVASIYRPARATTTAGKANSRHWVLTFEPRAAPFIEPLMGWTGGTDTLQQVKLKFPSKEAAIAYARRQGLTVFVREPSLFKGCVCPYVDKSRATSVGWALDRLPEKPGEEATQPSASTRPLAA
ncbi:ETC complex I subunit [Virgifigura deserti]|uniref:ETC complex I subunit n=1 Tax=Virgifigura deserti TaxID=2268457 RepID=UPI003CCC2DF5